MTAMPACLRSVVAVSLLLMPSVAPAADKVNRVELLTPRAFGYFIGDAFTHEATITLDPGASLDRASLPRPGPLTYWLELTAVDLDDLGSAQSGRRYRLLLRYQTFYAPLEPKVLSTPELPLVALEADQRSSIVIPAWSFLMSPLREIISSRAGASLALHPDAVPRTHMLGVEQGLAAVSAAMAIAALGGLAWLRGSGFFRKRHRPFGAAARRVTRCLATSRKAETYLAALLALHRAFDAAAGHRLLADDLPSFLELRPGFRSVAGETAGFFTASRHAFFGGGAEQANALLPASDLVSLARRLAALERAGA
jgi:mxaA protein